MGVVSDVTRDPVSQQTPDRLSLTGSCTVSGNVPQRALNPRLLQALSSCCPPHKLARAEPASVDFPLQESSARGRACSRDLKQKLGGRRCPSRASELDHWKAKGNLNRDLWFDLQWSCSLMGHIMGGLSSVARDRKVTFAQSPWPRISQAQGFQNLSLFPYCTPSNLRQANLTVPTDWLPPVLFSVP